MAKVLYFFENFVLINSKKIRTHRTSARVLQVSEAAVAKYGVPFDITIPIEPAPAAGPSKVM